MKIGSKIAVMIAEDRVMYIARLASPRPRRMKEQHTAPLIRI